MADNIKNEVKEVKLEEKVENRPIIIQTEIDAYISDAMKGGPQKPDEIQVKDYTTEDTRNRMALPREIEKKYGRKYAFRWVNKEKRMVDRALYVRKWNIVNRLLFPDMPKHLFTTNGTIEIGDTILCFMPIEAAINLRLQPGRISSERVKNIPMEKWRGLEGDPKSPYYKPALGAVERDGEVLAANGPGMFVQPDVQPQQE